MTLRAAKEMRTLNELNAARGDVKVPPRLGAQPLLALLTLHVTVVGGRGDFGVPATPTPSLRGLRCALWVL